ncbi:hypothetical protein EBI_25854 [Enterocytozoon bieneusi H348]|nr:hypothetical protein EBI_25854 [Enterocytozoon bieneusi H348]|eukprot:XP_001827956.1 hypothetical protein EBI_25854 [Enterocytozoon bieneusi H348]
MLNTKIITFEYIQLNKELKVSKENLIIYITYDLEQKKEREKSFIIQINDNLFHNHFNYFEDLLKNSVLKYKINITTKNDLTLEVNDMIIKGIVKLLVDNKLIDECINSIIKNNYLVVYNSTNQIVQIIQH